MNKIATAGCLLLTAIWMIGCQSSGKNTIPEFPDHPSREAFEGFQWDTVSGAGLKFWGQHNDRIRIVTDESIPGAKIERSGQKESHYAVLRLFPLKNGKIEDLLDILPASLEWNDSIECSFLEKPTDRPGVKRYVLTPAGAYAQKIHELSSREPIPSTCGGWGVGNSGMRYFEIHDNRPDLALFVEIGQEAPLFDEKSIVISDEFQVENHVDSLKTVEGTLTIGHEIRSFVADGDSTAYWIVDRTNKLYPAYDTLTGGVKNGIPVHVKLQIQDIGKSEEGFAADYAGVYLVKEIIQMGK